jgi:diguanylate cyclase (GGDEF)-like protein
MINMNGTQLNLVQEGFDSVNAAANQVVQTLTGSVGSLNALPASLKHFYEHLQMLSKTLSRVRSGNPPYSFPIDHGPILRTVIQWRRREKAKELEGYRANATDSEVIAALDAQLLPFQELTDAPWFNQATPLRMPKVADFITLQRLAEISEKRLIPTPGFEDKFRILYAPSGLLTELGRLRDECNRRDLPIAVVFLDLDRFKLVNERYGEPRVDADLLPVFMRIVERTVFGHGQAYRHGGDEIVLLLPNCSQDLAQSLLGQLRSSLAAAAYAGIEERPTVSCGLCVVNPDSHLTDNEILERAARAKKFAKSKGRNAIASYSTPHFQEEDFILLTTTKSRRATR